MSPTVLLDKQTTPVYFQWLIYITNNELFTILPRFQVIILSYHKCNRSHDFYLSLVKFF